MNKDIVKIDGSYGEGGGQIVRTALALSILTDTPVKIENIRANRPNRGLKPQHLTVVKALRDMSDAEVKGASLGSHSLFFSPSELKGGKYKFDVGTAGSIVLILQTAMIALLNLDENIEILIRGGTDVRWAPSWDYFRYVFSVLVNRIGIDIDASLIKRGFYPKGGGEAIVTVGTDKEFKPFRIDSLSKYENVIGNIVLSSLPNHIATRIKHSILKFFLPYKKTIDVNIERDKSSFSEGVVVTLWSSSGNTVVGYTVLGETGLPSEKVGNMCADGLMKEIESGTSIDSYAVDQLLPYMAFVAVEKNKTSYFISRNLTNHARTVMWLIKKFLPVDFLVSNKNGLFKVVVKKSK